MIDQRVFAGHVDFHSMAVVSCTLLSASGLGMYRSGKSPRLFALATFIALEWCATSLAGHARLKTGMTFEGTPVWLQGITLGAIQRNQGPTTGYPVLMVDDGMRRIFIPRKQVDDLSDAADFSKYDSFELKQHHTSRKQMLASLEGYAETTEFNEFGQRTHTVNTQFGPKQLVVGIEKITPQLLYLTSLNYEWQHAVSTTSIPPEKLDVIVHKAIDSKNPEDRLAVARFYLQAGLHPQCAAELDSILRDFPELKARVAQVRQELRQLQAKLILQELRRRKSAGQHRLAYESLQRFPTEDMGATVLREIRDLKNDYDLAHEKGEKALLLLAELQAKVDSPDLVSTIAPFRSFVRDELNYETLPRLEAFLNLAGDSTLSASEKLALAYSGWIVGNSSAVTDLKTAANLWKARLIVADYLRAKTPQERTELLTRLEALEGIGTEQILKLVPFLPMTIDTPNMEPAEPMTVEIDDGLPGNAPVYHVLLPDEYVPSHKYPMIVALRPADRRAPQELIWWGGGSGQAGQSLRHGYIVIAPEYATEKAAEYDYDVSAHDIVLRSINDARKRFRVDSDRIFLSGHGMGGDAAFDIGMSHPDLFAGVIPIAGVCDNYCRWYFWNANQTAWYIVGGELDLDRNTATRDLSVVNNMMDKLRLNTDVVLVEYMGRGYEAYYEEIHRLFEWMELHQRRKYPTEVELKILRPSENRCHWVQAEGFPPNVTQSAVLAGKSRGHVTPMTLSAQILSGNADYNVLTLRSGADRHTVWFSQEFIDYGKRLRIRVRNNQIKFNDVLKPSTETLLEDLRLRGDREMLFTARVDVD